MRRRLMATTALTALTTLLLAAPASAHVTANPSEAAAGGFGRVALRVPHGCGEEPTSVLSVKIPGDVASVKPEFIPGWTVSTVIGALDEPIELHGQTVTDGVREIVWTAEAGNELPNDQFREFGITFRAPERDGVLYFPTIQGCPSGAEEAWIEIPSSEGEELEKPAPSVTLVAGDSAHGDGHVDGHGDGDGEATAGPAEGATETVSPVALASNETSDSDTLAVIALIVAAVGLATGLAGLGAARRRN